MPQNATLDAAIIMAPFNALLLLINSSLRQKFTTEAQRKLQEKHKKKPAAGLVPAAGFDLISYVVFTYIMSYSTAKTA
jgi:hypothetical protein